MREFRAKIDEGWTRYSGLAGMKRRFPFINCYKELMKRSFYNLKDDYKVYKICKKL